VTSSSGPAAGASQAARGAAKLRERVTAAIADAVIEELADKGYGAFSMSAVAQRAGVGKAALYRRWPGKEPMILEVIAPRAVAVADLPDTGSLDGDLRAFLGATREALGHPIVARIAGDLFAESMRSPALGDDLRAAITVPRRAGVAAMLDRAITRGEISPDLDLGAALDLLAGPLVVHMFTAPGRADDRYVDTIHAMLRAALTTGA
jgi:AcrR family transcriptional regulator